MSRSCIRELQQDKISHILRKKMELQLLRAFDDQNEEVQNTQRKSSLLPKGILNKNYHKKLPQKQQSRHINLSASTNKTHSKQNQKSLQRNLLLLKAVQSPKNKKLRYEHSLYFKQQPTNRSNSSKTSMSSVKSFHHNKRKRLMTEFYQQKQTQKMVKKILSIKPSPQLNRQVQKQSYKKHVIAKNIMMHRVSDQPLKRNTILLKNKKSQGNTIDLKQKDLQKFLKDEKKKICQQSVIEKLSGNNQNNHTSHIYKRRRLRTFQAQNSGKKQVYSKSSAIIPVKPIKLPKVRIFTHLQTMPIEKSLSLKHNYKTPLHSRNKNYL